MPTTIYFQKDDKDTWHIWEAFSNLDRIIFVSKTWSLVFEADFCQIGNIERLEDDK